MKANSKPIAVKEAANVYQLASQISPNLKHSNNEQKQAFNKMLEKKSKSTGLSIFK